VLNNSWGDTGVGLVRAVSISQTQGIIQYPIKVMAPNTTMRDVRIEAITPFHFPNHCSSQLIKGSFIPEVFVSSFDRAVKPWGTVVTVPSGAVLLGMYIQHSPPIRTHAPPLSLLGSCPEPFSFPMPFY
jgi:hypothetical protein